MITPTAAANPPRILRQPETSHRTGASRTTLYDWMRKGIFPQSVRTGPRSIGWRESDIEAWINSREQGRCEPPPIKHDKKRNPPKANGKQARP